MFKEITIGEKKENPAGKRPMDTNRSFIEQKMAKKMPNWENESL